MKLPKQMMPVQRLSNSATPANNQQGVEASGVLDDILKVVSTVGTVAAPVVSSLLP